MDKIKKIGSLFYKFWKLVISHPAASVIISLICLVITVLALIPSCVESYQNKIPNKMLEEAHELLDDGKNEDARIKFSGLILDYGDNKYVISKSYSGRANANFHLNEFELARSDANTAIEHNAGNGDAYFILGRIYSLEEESDKAITYFNKALSQSTIREEEVYLHRGIEFLKIIEHDLALNDFNKALEINPNYEDALLYRDKIYAMKEDLTSMLEDLRQKTGASATRFIHLQRKDYGHTIEDMDKRIKLNSEDYDAYCIRGDLYYRKGYEEKSADNHELAIDCYNRSIDDFSQAININPDKVEAYIGRFMACFAIDDYGCVSESDAKIRELQSSTK